MNGSAILLWGEIRRSSLLRFEGLEIAQVHKFYFHYRAIQIRTI